MWVLKVIPIGPFVNLHNAKQLWPTKMQAFAEILLFNFLQKLIKQGKHAGQV